MVSDHRECARSRACRTSRRRSERVAQSEAGKRVKRFIAASPSPVIRDDGRNFGGACHDNRRSSQVLLAAGAEEYERQELSRRAERRRMAGMSATLKQC
jgi:hypothetical protein